MSMASMKAVTFRDFGGPEVLELTEVDRPKPGADDVLVHIHAAGICYHDGEVRTMLLRLLESFRHTGSCHAFPGFAC